MNYDLLQTTNDPSAFKQFYMIPKYYCCCTFLIERPKNFENEKLFLCLKIEKNHIILIITPEKQDKTFLELSKH